MTLSMTLREATKNGVDYWDFSVLVADRQIRVNGGTVKRCWHFENTNAVSINNLSAPANLKAVKEGNGWYQFALGDGRLTVWPSDQWRRQ